MLKSIKQSQVIDTLVTQHKIHCSELNSLAGALMATVSSFKSLEPDLEAIKSAADQLTRSFSGSWLGYHSRVYFEDFQIPPPGAVFSIEWGLMLRSSNDSTENWREYDSELVKEHLFRIADGRSLDHGRNAAIGAIHQFNTASREVLSILEVVLMSGPDSFLTGLKEDIQSLRHSSMIDIADNWIKSKQGKPITIRDVRAVNEGTSIPPHFEVMAEVLSIQNAFDVCAELAGIASNAASHIQTLT